MENVSPTMTPRDFGNPSRHEVNLNRVDNDLRRMFCVVLHNFENPPALYDCQTEASQTIEDIAINRYRSDAFFHAKVNVLAQQTMRIVEQYI
jgi:hypothetical protein